MVADLRIDHETGRAALIGAVDRFLGAVDDLDDRALLAASWCHGWAVLDVVAHVHTALREMLGGVVAPTTATPDQDAASYWREYAATDDEVDGIMWTRRTASAHQRPRGAVQHLRMVSETLCRGVQRMAEGPVAFQGHVLDSGDILATWAVELTVHHLDLGREISISPPDPGSTRLARQTIEALLDAPLPAEWSDETCLLLGAGRRAPSDLERQAAGQGGCTPSSPRMTQPARNQDTVSGASAVSRSAGHPGRSRTVPPEYARCSTTDRM